MKFFFMKLKKIAINFFLSSSILFKELENFFPFEQVVIIRLREKNYSAKKSHACQYE